jgi:sugar lactone lactonase YvrE
MTTLGLIGNQPLSNGTGIFGAGDLVERERAKGWPYNYIYTGTFRALTTTNAIVTAKDVNFSPDGTKLYVIGGITGYGTGPTFANVSNIVQWNLSEPYNIATAVDSGIVLPIGNLELTADTFDFSEDGTKLFIGGSFTRTFWQADLSTPWDLTTAVFRQGRQVRPINGQGTSNAGWGLQFSTDGTKFYFITNNIVYQYDLTTAWDLETADYASKSFSVLAQDNAARGLFFKPDGTKFYMVGIQNDNVRQYSMSTAWDISTASYDTVTLNVGGQEATPTSIYLSPDGIKLYVMGQTGDDVNEYTLGTAWEINTATYVRVTTAALLAEGAPTALWFKEDGTKAWTTGSGTDQIRQYTLSTPWNVSTMAHEGTLLVQNNADPVGLCFSDDGNFLFVTQSVRVFRYNLRTPWDVRTAVPFNLSYPGQQIQMASDGLSMLATTGANIDKYTLSTAFDLTTADTTPTETLAVNGIRSFWVDPSGRYMLVLLSQGSNRSEAPGGASVMRFDLPAPFTLTGAIGRTPALPLRGIVGAVATPWSVSMGPEQRRLFVVSDAVAGMYQFDLRF